MKRLEEKQEIIRRTELEKRQQKVKVKDRFPILSKPGLAEEVDADRKLLS